MVKMEEKKLNGEDACYVYKKKHVFYFYLCTWLVSRPRSNQVVFFL